MDLDTALLKIILGSFYFAESFRSSNFENPGCVTVNFPLCFPTGTMALQEPKKLLRNHDFQSSVTGISDKIDTSLILLIWLKFIYISFFTVNAMILFEGGLLFWGGGAVRPHKLAAGADPENFGWRGDAVLN